MRISDWSSDVCSSDLFGSVMLCTGGGEIGTRFVQAAFQLLALSIQPFQREGGFVSSAERFAEHLIGAGERGSACRQLFRSEEHTSELQSLMRISYAVFCLNKKTNIRHHTTLSLTH